MLACKTSSAALIFAAELGFERKGAARSTGGRCARWYPLITTKGMEHCRKASARGAEQFAAEIAIEYRRPDASIEQPHRFAYRGAYRDDLVAGAGGHGSMYAAMIGSSSTISKRMVPPQLLRTTDSGASTFQVTPDGS